MQAQEQIRPAKADDFHQTALVIDSLSPDMASFAAPMIARLDELIASGCPSHLIWLAMKDLADDLLLADSYPEYWKWWELSGVDVASVTMGGFGPNPFSFNAVVSDVARWTARFDKLGGRVRKVTRGSDARQVHADGAHGIILNLQNSEHIEADLSKLAVLHNLGIRIIQLTYNTRTLAGDGFAERNPAGLSKFGIDLVRRLNALGILVDVSHCSEPTTLDAIRASDAPIAVTHAFATAVSGHPRGKSDRVVEELAARGGYFGILLVPFFLRPGGGASVNDFIEHLRHIVSIAGAEHVGIGTDWGMELPAQMVSILNADFARLGFEGQHGVDWGTNMAGCNSWAELPNVTQAMFDAGYSEKDVRGFLGGNFLRIFEAVCG
jgi:membrane dipeptidase